MDNNAQDFQSFLQILPPVEFACVYGSSLHPTNHDKVFFCFMPIHFICYIVLIFVLIMCFWLCRQPWLIIFLVFLTLYNGILRYWFVMMCLLCHLLNELLNIWMSYWYNFTFFSLSCFFNVINQESENE